MKTDLYDRHVALGAKVVEFGGWWMPLQYQGIIPEHHAVRQQVGVFDVSHMGQIDVAGEEAGPFLDYLCTNTIADRPNGSATYTVLCHENGGSVDDIIVYKEDAHHFFIVVNAANRTKDLAHLMKYAAQFGVTITPRYTDRGILAIQGPQAAAVLPEGDGLKPMRFKKVGNLTIAATGYTGAGGYECLGPASEIRTLWDRLIQAGVTPVGLGARDTLRLEMGYALYGHELSDTIAPTETVSAWTVKSDKTSFIGKEAQQRYTRHEYGVVLQDKGIAREGYPVFLHETQIGVVTSGTHSPTLGKAIAIILVDRKCAPEDHIQIQIRNHRAAARITPLPFLEKR